VRVRLTYRTCVLGGCSIAIAVATLFATRAGLTPLLWIAVAAFAVSVAFVLAIATKVLFGVESFSFLHYQIAAIVATAVIARDALNLLALTLAIAQAFGRIGCANAGCCHGRGRFPLQRVESALLFAIAAICAMRIDRAFVIYTLAYAATRFALEYLRGDRRRSFRGVSEAQWICVATSIAMIAVDLAAIPVAAVLIVATIVRFEIELRVATARRLDFIGGAK